jgi:DNA-binding transcriptional LysR family regulator
MNILSADLNLLVALDALLQERNVTRAGARIGVSQSAMSSALSRLRRQFDDELLVRVGTRYELTPLAQVLTGRVSEVLRLIEKTLSSQPTFDPSSSTREFRVVGSDYALTLLTPYLMSMLQQQAPQVKLRLESVRPIAVDSPEELLRTVDLLLIPRGHFTGLPVKDLFRDRWVCVTGADNARADQPYTLTDVGELRWARAFAPVSATLADRQIDDIVDFGQHTDVVVDTFSMLPPAVSGTTLYAMVQERLVRECLDRYRLRIVDLPVTFAPLVEAAWWHPSRQLDPGHQWFRALVRQAASLLEDIDFGPNTEPATNAFDNPVQEQSHD